MMAYKDSDLHMKLNNELGLVSILKPKGSNTFYYRLRGVPDAKTGVAPFYTYKFNGEKVDYNNTMKESLSRGALYRKRYYGRY